MSDVAAIIASMRDRGVKLWVEHGEVHYKIPAGEGSHQELQILRARKAEIVRFFEESLNSVAVETPLVPRRASDRVPLTFAQLEMWKHLRTFGMQQNTRSCANALRISGAVNVECLARAFSEVVRRHEILRMRIVPGEDDPSQELSDAGNCALEIVNLKGSSTVGRDEHLRLLVDELVNQHCDVTAGSLFAARLISADEHDHVLVVTLDHIIADAVSMGIVLRDAWMMYLQCISGLPIALPRLPVQFADYAVWERKTNAEWCTKHSEYWRKRLAGDPRTRVPAGKGPTDGACCRTVQVPIGINRELTEALRELSRREHTTLVMSVLAAYIAFLSRWSQTEDVIVGLILAGRHRPELGNTVGLFAYRTYLRVAVPENDRFVNLLQRTTREHYLVCNHQDFGRLALAWPTAEYTKTTGFNWQGRTPANLQAAQPRALIRAAQCNPIRLQPFSFNKRLQHSLPDERFAAVDEPELLLAESTDGIRGKLLYQEDRCDAAAMQSFGRNFQLAVAAVLVDPQASIAAIRCRS